MIVGRCQARMNILTNRNDYTERLTEICGTKRSSEIAEKLGITYQTARNYLNGRLPDSSVLIKIAEQTPYSVHWLLTGKGEKLTDFAPFQTQNTPLLPDQIKVLVRDEIVRFFTDAVSGQATRTGDTSVLENKQSIPEQSAEPRIVRLPAAQIKREKHTETINRSSKKSE